MKTISKLIIFSFALWVISPLSTMARKDSSKRKDINWSVNFNKQQDSVKVTLFNLGLISNITEQRGVGVNLIYSAVHQRMSGMQVAGFLGYSHDAAGLQIGGLANFVKQDFSGFMLSGLMNAAGGDGKGLQLSAITNISGKSFKGAALSGIMNVATDEMSGIQMSGILNASGNLFRGIQVSLLSNVGANVSGVQSSVISNIAASQIKGLQLSGVANIAFNADKAFQFSSLTNVCLDTLRGVQLSLGNYAENVRGAQIGLLNLSTGKVHGWQVGVVNHSKDTTAHKIGLVNINPRTKIQAMIFGSNTSKINVAVRFKNKTNYSILGIGTQYFDMNEDFSGCLFYRTGLYFPIKKKFEISGDLGYFHIENFEDESTETPDRLYSVQARLNLSYRILPKLSIFASTGYAMTRYYKKNKLFENKGIIEGGIILF